MAAPNLTVDVEPVEGGKVRFLALAAKKAGAGEQVKIVLRLNITNQAATVARVNRIRFDFPGSQVAGVDMKGVDEYYEACLRNIAAGATEIFSNGSLELKSKEKIDNAVYLNAPAPGKIKVSIWCDEFDDPFTLTRDLAAHSSPISGGAYQWPYRVSDLRVGEYVSARGGHWANGGKRGTQIYAHDVGMQGVGKKGEKLSGLLPGGKKENLDDYRIWNKPLRAMADGTVEDFFDGADDHAVANKPTLPEGDPGEGNHFWIKHGDEYVVYCHMKKNSLPDALKKKGAKVKAGQMLGRVGNSGRSSNPHTHIECRGNAKNGPLRPLVFRDAWLVEGDAVKPPDPAGPWVKMNKRGVPKDGVIIWPAASEPSWYPPGWAELARHGIKESAYQAEFDKITSSGYRPVWVNAYQVDGDVFFNAIFRPADGIAWHARHGLTGDEYQKEWNVWVKQKKYRLLHVQAYSRKGSVRYAPIWVKAPGPAFEAYHGLDHGEHEKRLDDLKAKGFVPVGISVASPSGSRVYAALYEKKNVGGWEARSFLTPDEYQAEFNDNWKKKRYLAYLNAYNHSGGTRIVGIWFSKATPGPARHGMTSAQYQKEFDEQMGKGNRTRAVAGYERNGEHGFAAYWTGD